MAQEVLTTLKEHPDAWTKVTMDKSGQQLMKVLSLTEKRFHES